MIKLKTETEYLLLSITKTCGTLFKQTETTRNTSSLPQPRELFHLHQTSQLKDPG